MTGGASFPISKKSAPGAVSSLPISPANRATGRGTDASVLYCHSRITECSHKKAEAEPSGTIHLDEWKFMAMISGDFGHGTLSYNDKIYKFKVRGMGALGYGVQKL